ncbi:MAG TPA: aminotransferase class V-fold PLP-dependent enzyme [Novosphingobium sp.]|nr:aminotransferase class V-fold PLP-dependent enzyme [Novosphingobium sp.]
MHLNAASLGPTSRAMLAATIEAWRRLESSPVYMGYGKSGDDKVVIQADAVRGKAAALLGCDAEEIMITHGTTDGMNTVAQGIVLSAGDRILTTDQEHEGGSLCWEYRARRDGVTIDRIAILPTEFDALRIVWRFEQAITPATRIISFSHVITTTGLRMPVAEIAALARRRGILCVVDGAQAAGNIPVDVKALGCDAYATSGHKWLMGPKGTGLLYVSREADAQIVPIQWGDARRYGAEAAGVGAMTLVVGFGAALDAIRGWGMAAIERRNLDLRTRMYEGLREIEGLRVVGPPPGPLASAIVACALPDALDSRMVQQALHDRHGILVKMAEKRWLNGLRFSPHVFNTIADVDYTLRALRTELRPGS